VGTTLHSHNTRLATGHLPSSARKPEKEVRREERQREQTAEEGILNRRGSWAHHHPPQAPALAHNGYDDVDVVSVSLMQTGAQPHPITHPPQNRHWTTHTRRCMACTVPYDDGITVVLPVVHCLTHHHPVSCAHAPAHQTDLSSKPYSRGIRERTDTTE
jgi:hypothetical protein